MRRKDREVTDQATIRQIILDAHCCRLGLQDEGEVYIVPMNFGYVEEEGEQVFYFHCAYVGRKLDLMAKHPKVCFELDTKYQLLPHPEAWEYTATFQSVIGQGMAELVTDPVEKRRGLVALMEHSAGPGDWTFPDHAVNGVCVFKVTVLELACKVHLSSSN